MFTTTGGRSEGLLNIFARYQIFLPGCCRGGGSSGQQIFPSDWSQTPGRCTLVTPSLLGRGGPCHTHFCSHLDHIGNKTERLIVRPQHVKIVKLWPWPARGCAETRSCCGRHARCTCTLQYCQGAKHFYLPRHLAAPPPPPPRCRSVSKRCKMTN